MHGPALTQAMSFLASRGSELPQWAWVLDSDAVISRPDALEKAVNRAEETNAAIVGESWRDPWHETDRFLAYSLLIDPVRVWRDGVEPFADGGDPAFDLLQPAKAQGETLAEFSFVRDLQVPETVSPHATWAYSRIRPSSLSRRRTRMPGYLLATVDPGSGLGLTFPGLEVGLRSTRGTWQVHGRYMQPAPPPRPTQRLPGRRSPDQAIEAMDKGPAVAFCTDLPWLRSRYYRAQPPFPALLA